jgi:hypothetical protein
MYIKLRRILVNKDKNTNVQYILLYNEANVTLYLSVIVVYQIECYASSTTMIILYSINNGEAPISSVIIFILKFIFELYDLGNME